MKRYALIILYLARVSAVFSLAGWAIEHDVLDLVLGLVNMLIVCALEYGLYGR